MKGFFVRFVVSALALYLTALLATSIGINIHLTGLWTTVIAVVALGIVNNLIRPIIVILTLPLNCLTLGLLTFVINALMFWLVGSGWLEGFRVEGPIAALFGSVVMSIIMGLVNPLINKKESR
jgi:putative membrane protein